MQHIILVHTNENNNFHTNRMCYLYDFSVPNL
jgi:hypothetical protein